MTRFEECRKLLTRLQEAGGNLNKYDFVMHPKIFSELMGEAKEQVIIGQLIIGIPLRIFGIKIMVLDYCNPDRIYLVEKRFLLKDVEDVIIRWEDINYTRRNAYNQASKLKAMIKEIDGGVHE